MRRVDENQPIGSGNQPVIGALLLSFDQYVFCELLHNPTFIISTEAKSS
jgi:hypothetical protein